MDTTINSSMPIVIITFLVGVFIVFANVVPLISCIPHGKKSEIALRFLAIIVGVSLMGYAIR